MASHLFLVLAGVVAVTAVAGCGGGGTAAAQMCCTPAPFFLRLSTSMTSAAVPDSTTEIDFSTDNQPTGTPHLSGSDGSSFDASALSPADCILPTGSNTDACGTYATVAGLKPQTTYTVTFAAVTLASNFGGPTTFDNVNAGSFQTQ
jgi:hypothetical protein